MLVKISSHFPHESSFLKHMGKEENETDVSNWEHSVRMHRTCLEDNTMISALEDYQFFTLECCNVSQPTCEQKYGRTSPI